MTQPAAIAFGRAKILEVGDGHGIGRSAFGPGGGVDGVAGFTAAHEQIEAVFPEAVIDETDGDRAGDAESFSDDRGGRVEFLDRARTDDAVEVAGRPEAQGQEDNRPGAHGVKQFDPSTTRSRAYRAAASSL